MLSACVFSAGVCAENQLDLDTDMIGEQNKQIQDEQIDANSNAEQQLPVVSQETPEIKQTEPDAAPDSVPAKNDQEIDEDAELEELLRGLNMPEENNAQ